MKLGINHVGIVLFANRKKRHTLKFDPRMEKQSKMFRMSVRGWVIFLELIGYADFMFEKKMSTSKNRLTIWQIQY